MRLLIVFLTFLLVLTACAAPAKPAIAPEDVSGPGSDTPVLAGTFETSLLVTEGKGNSEGNLLFPFDPASGSALPGYTPISLGQISFHALSPDRRTLAVVSFTENSTYKGSLLLIDLIAWKSSRFEVDLFGWVNTMVFSPDGRRLAIAHGETSHKLTMVDIERGIILAQRQIDSFLPHMKFADSGEALMLYSPTIDTVDGLGAGPPQVLLVDAADLSPLWSAELAGVRDGIFPKDETVTQPELYEPGNAFYLSPGLAFAPDRDALYVLHADSEQLTTVDFENRTIETVEIQTKLTWLEKLFSLTAGVAHAKIADGTNKQAAISPDGQFLYVVGVDRASFQNKHGNWQMEETPLGLEIIQTADGARVERFETDSAELSLSPDGRFLYLRNWGPDAPWTEIFDTSTQKVIAHEAKIFAMPAFLMNGEFLLVSTYQTSETSQHLSVLGPDRLNEVAEWTVNDDTYFYWLTLQ